MWWCQVCISLGTWWAGLHLHAFGRGNFWVWGSLNGESVLDATCRMWFCWSWQMDAPPGTFHEKPTCSRLRSWSAHARLPWPNCPSSLDSRASCHPSPGSSQLPSSALLLSTSLFFCRTLRDWSLLFLRNLSETFSFFASFFLSLYRSTCLPWSKDTMTSLCCVLFSAAECNSVSNWQSPTSF